MAIGSTAALSWFSRQKPLAGAAETAFARVVAQARQPVFFTRFGVPDTLDGRFELLCLHAFLYLHRLKRERPGSQVLAQAFFDRMFVDLDRSLRETGVGDLSVGRHVKRMAEGFYGRVRAYEAGLAGDDGALQAALRRNLYGTAPAGAKLPLDRAAAYVRDQVARLAGEATAALLAGDVVFAEPAAAR